MTVQPLRGEAGAIVGCVGVAVDITRSKQLEAGIEGRTGSLEKQLERLTERTEELPPQLRKDVGDVLEALRLSLEELQVASEELEQQNQELTVAQGELHAMQRRYHDLFELAPDGYLVTDVHGVIRQANQAALDLLAVPREALSGKPLVLFMAPGDRDRFRSYLDRVVRRASAGTKVVEWETRMQPHRGIAFPAALTVSPMREDDELSGLRWLVRDIRASKRAEDRERLLAETHEQRWRAEESARESEATSRLLRALIATMPVGVVVSDSEGTILGSNIAAREILGSEVAGTVGRPQRDYRPNRPNGSTFLPQDMPLAVALAEGREVRDVEILIQRVDGGERIVLVSAAPVSDDAGQIVSGVAVFQDVTERKRTEDVLRFQSRALDQIADAVVAIDHEERVTYVNRAAVERYETDFEEAIGRKLEDLYDYGWLRPEDERTASAALEACGHWRGENVHVTRSGRRYDVESAVSVLQDSSGNPTGLLAAVRDVTARKQAEAQHERLLQILEATPDLVAMFTPGGEVLYVNEAARQILDMEGDHIGSPLRTGWVLYQAYPAWAAELIQNEAIPAAVRDGLWRGRTAMLSADGQEIPMSQVILAHEGPDGEMTYLSTIARDVSERDKLLGELAQSRSRLQAIIDNAPEGIVVADREGRIVFSNDTAVALYRRPVPYGEDYHSHGRLELCQPDGRPMNPRDLPLTRAALDGEKSENQELAIVWPNGQRRDLLVNAAPMEDEEGNVVGAVGVFQDITDRKSVERARAVYAESLDVLHRIDQVILEAASVDEILEAALPLVPSLLGCQQAGVVSFDAESGEAFVLGVASNAGGQAGEALVHKGDRVLLTRTRFLDELAQGQMQVVDDLSALPLPRSLIEVLRAAGVRAFVTVPLMARGELLGALVLGLEEPAGLGEEQQEIVRDVASELAVGIQQARLRQAVEDHAERLEVTVARRTRALRASEARFRSILENAAIGIALLNREGRIVTSNPALQQTLGYSGAELQAMRFEELIHPEDDETDQDLYGRIVKGDLDLYEIEKRFMRKDGQVRWGLLTVSRAERGARGVQHVIAMVQDITEQKRAQEALIESERLAIAGKMGAVIAHEVNNPLQTVIGCLGLVDEELAAGGDASPYLEVARAELRRAAQTVAQLRDLARPSRIEDRQLVDLNDLVEQVLMLTRKACENQAVEVRWEGGDDLRPVPLVPEQMHQVLLNLVLNAVEAMPSGGRLTLSTTWSDEPAGARLVVSDSGVGMPSDVAARVFEPFYTTKAEGLGLGLYVTRTIVEQHGGQINVQSTLGKGTAFEVWLPT
jgi:PAS domain S-box-containing protein